MGAPSVALCPPVQTIDRVRRVVADVLELDETESLHAETRFLEDLEADSIRLIELLFVLEEEFGIEIDEPTGLGLQTIGEVAARIDRTKLVS